MVSKDGAICPHCKGMNSKNKAIGTSGLVPLCGSTFEAVCNRCGKHFYGVYSVSVTYKTRKRY